MNKKEIAEIKKNFSDDCGFFTVGHVISAFVDSEKNIKYKSNRLYNTLPAEEAELIMIILKKVLSGQIGKNLLEYSFPKESYSDGGSQSFLYEVLKSKFTDDDISDKFLNEIVEKTEYVSTYSIFSAYCTYSVLKKNKNDDFGEDADLDYNFIITAICPVNLRIDGLVYNEETNEIAKKADSDRIVELPSDGFLFPVFNDRTPDVNGVMYYTKNAKKPNTSIVDNLLGCEFVMSCQSEKATFHAILNNVVADELDYSMITTVNEKIQEIVDQNSHETEIPTIDKNRLSSILWESGVSQEKLEHLPKVYETAMGDKPLTAVNLVDKKTVLSVPSITVNIKKDAVDKVRTQIIDGKKCLIIDLDDPDISVNGITASIE
ncbi:MAG: DUF4317 domain-containing protein [Oscillospiraceae bacterium]